MSTHAENADAPDIADQSNKYVQYVLIGDSDISNWPSHLWPITSVPSLTQGEPVAGPFSNGTFDPRKLPPAVIKVSERGAVLRDVPNQVLLAQDRLNKRTLVGEGRVPAARTPPPSTTVVFVVCAGENDVSSGAAMERVTETVVESSNRVARSVFDPEDAAPGGAEATAAVLTARLVVLGPKLGPRSEGDGTLHERYTLLNRTLQTSCRRLEKELCGGNHDRIGEDGRVDDVGQCVAYVDCLNAFYERERTVAECVVPDGRCFDIDGLHLNLKGYAILKKLVESTVGMMLQSPVNR